MKLCPCCNTRKEMGEFYHARSRNGDVVVSGYCKDCDKARMRKSRNTRRGKQKRRTYYFQNKPRLSALSRIRNIQRYGITVEQFNELLSRQNNRCPVCEKKFCKSRGPVIDHCHDTTVVRGLLCLKCNAAVGALGDDVDSVLRACEYLECPPTNPAFVADREERHDRQDRGAIDTLSKRDAAQYPLFFTQPVQEAVSA